MAPSRHDAAGGHAPAARDPAGSRRRVRCSGPRAALRTRAATPRRFTTRFRPASIGRPTAARPGSPADTNRFVEFKGVIQAIGDALIDLVADGRGRAPEHRAGGNRPRHPRSSRGRAFTGGRRRRETHQSTTDPEARLYRTGPQQAARLCYPGHLRTENRHGLVLNVELTDAYPCSSQGPAATPDATPPRRCSQAAACPALDAESRGRARAASCATGAGPATSCGPN